MRSKKLTFLVTSARTVRICYRVDALWTLVIRPTGRPGADERFKAAADAQSVNLVGSRVYQTAEIKFLPVTT
jgi:hypothetical protein